MRHYATGNPQSFCLLRIQKIGSYIIRIILNSARGNYINCPVFWCRLLRKLSPAAPKKSGSCCNYPYRVCFILYFCLSNFTVSFDGAKTPAAANRLRKLRGTRAVPKGGQHPYCFNQNPSPPSSVPFAALPSRKYGFRPSARIQQPGCLRGWFGG